MDTDKHNHNTNFCYYNGENYIYKCTECFEVVAVRKDGETIAVEVVV